MDDSIDDSAARVFASQLYSSIAFGLDLQKAFDQALLQVRLILNSISGEPQLYTSDSMTADEIVLVAPSEAQHQQPAEYDRTNGNGFADRTERDREVRETVIEAVNAARRWAQAMQVIVIATASARWRDSDWAEWVNTDSGRQAQIDAQTMRDAGPRLRLSATDETLLSAVADAMAVLDDSGAFDGIHRGLSTPDARSAAYRHISQVTRAWSAVEAAVAASLAA